MSVPVIAVLGLETDRYSWSVQLAKASGSVRDSAKGDSRCPLASTCTHMDTYVYTPILKVLQKQSFTVTSFHTVKTHAALTKIKRSEYSITQVQVDISLPFLSLL